VVRGARLDNVKPDLLVHVPGKMDHNLVVVEIKAASPRPPADERVAVERSDLREDQNNEYDRGETSRTITRRRPVGASG
jgi:hypothetical protein